MSLQIIIRGKSSCGKTRSEQEENLRKEWGATMTDEQLDKLKFIERKQKEKIGAKKSFIRAVDIDKLK